MSDDARRVTVDEISANAAGEKIATLVTDDGGQLVVPLAMLPPGTRRGAVLTLSFIPDEAERSRRLARVRDLQRRLFGNR